MVDPAPVAVPGGANNAGDDELWELAETLWAKHRPYLESVLANAPRPDPVTIGRLRRMVRRPDDQAAA